MKKTKQLIIFFLLILGSSSFAKAGQIDDFKAGVQQLCPAMSSLMIKKSMIELNKNTSIACEQKFTSLLVTRCKNINCNEIIRIHQKVKDDHSGSVFGGR